jgi:hypothetical protein
MPSPADVVERLLEAANPNEETFRLLADDAEIKPLESEHVLRGLPEIKRYAATLGPSDFPLVRGATVYEVGDTALVYTLNGDEPGARRKPLHRDLPGRVGRDLSG